MAIQLSEQSLEKWLSHIENLHSKAIDLGLERMQIMLDRLQIKFSCPVILVGGTNGKGSTCNCLEQILSSAGYKVCVHTSPHLIKFNERARIAGRQASDESLVREFRKVEEARRDLTLSYFEYTLLGILLLFQEENPDALILEIGLGGRLDAVNTIEPDASIVTTVGLDHTAFLGDTREKIGWEKAHIFRSGKPAVCADPNPPETLVSYADEIGADLILPGRDYFFSHPEGSGEWRYEFRNFEFKDLPLPALEGEHQVRNAAGAITVLLTLGAKLPVKEENIREGLQRLAVTGRFQKVASSPEIILDVGHNPHAALELEKTLGKHPVKGLKIAVMGMLKDKDRQKVCEILKSSFDKWYLGDLEGPRAGTAQDLKQFLTASGVSEKDIYCFPSVRAALREALNSVQSADTILIFGSFLTVTSAVEELNVAVV